VDAHFTQEAIAGLLKIPQTRYAKYEGPMTLRLLPHEMIVDFCMICRVRTEWLLTGKGPIGR
jgi:hypothetical protein